MTKTVDAEIRSLFVISGKGKDISLPKYDKNPNSRPENRARWVIEPAAFRKILKVPSKAFKLRSKNGRPSEEECRTAAEKSLADAGLEGWQTGPLLVKGRAIQPDGTWVPIPGASSGSASDGTFAYAFLLQRRDANSEEYKDYTIPMPLKKAYAEARLLLVVQST